MKNRIIFIILGLFSWGLVFSQIHEKNSCIMCHSEIKAKYEGSVHLKADIKCHACHNGNPAIFTKEAMSSKYNFIGKIKKQDIPEFCAKCHSDVVKMRYYDLRTDQLALYKISIHGKRLYNNKDTKVAVCTDCHTAHSIYKSSNPKSSTYKKNIPEVCSKCHSNKKYMAEYKIPTGQYKKYINSEHGNQLISGNTNAPTCVDCHDNHGAAPPGAKDVSDVCGKCHLTVREFFKQGPHKKAMDNKQIKECVSCHNNHNINTVDGNMFKTVCKKCHSNNKKIIQLSESFANKFSEISVNFNKLKEKFAQYEKNKINLSELEPFLLDISKEIKYTKNMQHDLDIENIEIHLNKIQDSIKTLDINIDKQKKSIIINKVFKYIIIFILLFIFLLLLYKVIKTLLIK